MKKYVFLLLLTFLIISCGADIEGETLDSQIGETWSIKTDDFLSTSEAIHVSNICSSLSSKSSFFKSVYVGTSTTLSMQVEQQNCGEESLNITPVQVSVINNNGELKFSSSSTTYFSDVLTHKSAIISDLCSEATNTTLRYVESTSHVKWVYVFDNKNINCSAGNDELCLKIVTGYKTENSQSYDIKEIDDYFISLSNEPSKNGVVTYRTQKQSHFCSEDGDFKTKSQTLKSIQF